MPLRFTQHGFLRRFDLHSWRRHRQEPPGKTKSPNSDCLQFVSGWLGSLVKLLPVRAGIFHSFDPSDGCLFSRGKAPRPLEDAFGSSCSTHPPLETFPILWSLRFPWSQVRWLFVGRPINNFWCSFDLLYCAQAFASRCSNFQVFSPR